MQITPRINVLELIAVLFGIVGVVVGLYAMREIRRDRRAMIDQEGYYGPRTELTEASFVLVLALTFGIGAFLAVGLVTLWSVNRVPMSLASGLVSSILVAGEVGMVLGLAYKTWTRRRLRLEDDRHEAAKHLTTGGHVDMEG